MARRAIVLVVDRVGAGHLGPYGNTLFATPGFNRLAATAWLGERALADSPHLDRVYRSYFSGRHALCPLGGEPGLCRRLAELGIASSLFTDDAQVSELAHGHGFGRCDEVPSPPVEAPASEIAETQLAAFFGQLIEIVESCPGGHLLWAHARGLDGPWDAPLDLREQLAAEDDPPPYAGVEPPAQTWNSQDEEEDEERWSLVCAHAAQIMVLDACLEALLGALSGDDQGEETMLLVTSPRGFPLGEHGEVGESATRLHEELLHVPLMVRLSDGRGAAARGPGLSQPADVPATLLDWFGGELPAGGGGRSLLPPVMGQDDEGTAGRHDRAVAVGREQAVLHASHWCWHGQLTGGQVPEGAVSTSLSSSSPGHSSPPAGKLFVKPDDRWEVNEVADLCPEVAVAMQAELARYGELAAQARLEELPPLASELEALPS